MKKILIELVFLGILLLCFTTLVNADKNTYSGDEDDGYLRQTSSDYTECWHYELGFVSIEIDELLCGQEKAGIYYFIYRAILFFDTSNLERSFHNITGANLRFYIMDDRSGTNFDITVQSVEANKPLEGVNYDQQIWTGNYGSVKTGDIQPYSTSYLEIELSQNWIDNILGYEGITIIGLRSDREIDEGTVPTNEEYVSIWTANYDTVRYRPQLRIYYTNYITFSGSTWFNVTESNTSANCSITYNYWQDNDTFSINGNNEITAFGNVTGYTWEELILISTPCFIIGILVIRIKRKKEKE